MPGLRTHVTRRCALRSTRGGRASNMVTKLENATIVTASIEDDPELRLAVGQLNRALEGRRSGLADQFTEPVFAARITAHQDR